MTTSRNPAPDWEQPPAHPEVGLIRVPFEDARRTLEAMGVDTSEPTITVVPAVFEPVDLTLRRCRIGTPEFRFSDDQLWVELEVLHVGALEAATAEDGTG